ncbi:hypothetical protein [Clostridium manihotivorum]|uniref:Hsp20/alpha crystallin family protein n=1 Tax=Clostridium manihotivorum TaxID=2320868 RepID=A0A410DY29_9CLOT|nr:hypothetical protein [Clostridium manihotivorum]QAA33989.1 hypothetical protein C1I91_21495 [Clostridium manihotivorum]
MFALFNMMSNFNESKAEFKMLDLDDKYVVLGKLIGVPRDNINLNYDNDYLTIDVLIKRVSNRSGYGGVVFFQQVNNVRKTFYVPNVDSRNIAGNFDGSNLIISLPKKILSIKNKVIIDVDKYIEENKLE